MIAGRYKILARLGTGGMGVVFRVRDRQLDEDIALKVLLPGWEGDEALERLRREVKFVRHVTHRNVCRVFDLGEDGKHHFLTMELIEGEPLRALLRRNALTPNEAFAILAQITAGLGAVHARGIIHRDLKPENVLICHSGRAVLVDFGLARMATTEVTTVGRVVGTPAYMSPEQLRAEPLDVRSDIFSLGIMAFELFAGYSPFGKGPAVSVMSAIIRDPPFRLVIPGLADQVVHAIEGVLRRAMAKWAEERFATTSDFWAALVAVWSGELAQYGNVPPEAEPTRPRVTNIPVQKDVSSSKRVEYLSETGARPPAARAARLGIAAILVLLLGMAVRPTASALLHRAHLVPAAQREDEAPRDGAAAEAAALARPGVRIGRFDNLTGDPSLNALAQGAADALRAELRTVPQIRVVEASADEGQASGAVKASVNWIFQGTVLRLGAQLRLTAHIEDASGASVGLPIELSGGEDKLADLLASLQKRAVEETKLLWHEETRRAWAVHATHDAAARSKLLEYYALIGIAPRDDHTEPGTQLLDQALTSSPDYIPALVERSYLRAMEGAVRGRPERFASALTDAERAASLAPEDARALVMHCRIRQVALMASSPITDAGIERAISACNDAMRADPLSAYVPLVLARLYDLTCQDDRAMASLERALELDGSLSGRILEHLVALALQHSRLALAERVSRRFVEFQEEEARLGPRAFSRRMGVPLSHGAHLYRGAVLLRLGQLEEAKVALERELQIISGQIGTKGAEAGAIRGLLRIARGQGRAAPPDLERRLSALEAEYLSAAASNPGVLMALASEYYLTEPGAAAAWIERLGALPSLREALGRATFYDAAGDSEAARRTLDACHPVERWEQACVDSMRARLSH